MLSYPFLNLVVVMTLMFIIPFQIGVLGPLFDAHVFVYRTIVVKTIWPHRSVCFVPPVCDAYVAVTHDRLPEVIEAMISVVLKFLCCVVREELLTPETLAYNIQAVKLMEHCNSINVIARHVRVFHRFVTNFRDLRIWDLDCTVQWPH